MKKFFVVVLGLTLCFGFVAGGYAIDDESLESRTTERLYDRTDPFDLAQQPGLLFELDRWRLYTVLSGYSGDDDLASDSFLMGTTGRLGPGSMALFYETDKVCSESTFTSTNFTRTDVDWGSFPNFDGKDDILVDSSSTSKSDSETENNNFLIGYGMDFDGFSAGISFAPELRDREEKVRIHWSPGVPNYLVGSPGAALTLFSNQWLFGALGNPAMPIAGNNSSWSSNITYLNEAQTAATSVVMDESFTGKRDRDRDVYPVGVQSKIHTADHWDLLAGVFYLSTDENDDISLGHTRTTTSANGATGYFMTQNVTTTANGSGSGSVDGDGWGITLEPTYEVNDLVTLRLDLAYTNEDLDIKGEGISGRTLASATRKINTSAVTETWSVDETWNGSSKGDRDIDEWGVEPRVYLTFDRVRFSLGVGYFSEERDDKLRSRHDKNGTYIYRDGDPAVSNDWTLVGSWTEDWTEKMDTEYSEWRFPVATEFDVTEKLTFRAGASYVRWDLETTTKTVLNNRTDEQYTAYGPGGVVSSVGPEEFFATAPTPAAPRGTPYQATVTGSTQTQKSDSCDDYTTYQLGLGYQFTENLQVDLMYIGENSLNSSAGGVDMTEVFASVTLAF